MNFSKKPTILDLKKLDKHIKDNFSYDANLEERELEVNKDIYWVEGYMCAVWSSPTLPRMDDWLPYINGDCVFKSESHVNQIISSIFGLQAMIVDGLNGQTYQPLYAKHNLNDEQPVDLVIKWCKGYMFGTLLASQDIFEEKDGEILNILGPIISIADVDISDAKKEKLVKKNIVDLIPTVANGLFKIFLEIRMRGFKNAIKSQKTPIRKTKVGDNEPCECGSGKKYKKCCKGSK
jgi:uncharacterized protein